MNFQQIESITFSELFPKADKQILDEFGLIKFRKENHDIDEINKNIRYFNESYHKCKDELAFLKKIMRPEDTKKWIKDEGYRKYILSLRRKDKPELETVPTMVDGTPNSYLSDEEYILNYITYKIASNLKRMEDLEQHISYATTALSVLQNPDFKIPLLNNLI